MSIGEEDWALSWSWPPAGDQWQYSVDQFFEPCELIDNKYGEAECPLFSDGVIVQNHGFNSTLSDGGSRMCSIACNLVHMFRYFCAQILLAV